MNIYISGITGTGMGPLGLMAKAAGFTVFGSDLNRGAIYDELKRAGIEVFVGEQDGKFLEEKLKEGVDWFVYTSALKEDHPELLMAKKAGIKVTKRDDLTEFLVRKLGLKMVAVAGTHGKTTTTSMIVFLATKMGLPVSYIVGTTLGFMPSGAYHNGDKYFIYEADEYDRNFLKYHPWLAVIPSVSYDHPDIYPTKEDYEKAFEDFKGQSERVLGCQDGKIKWMKQGWETMYEPEQFKLAGEARRIDAALAAEATTAMMFDQAEEKGIDISFEPFSSIDILNKFPGVGRRFEKISEGVYSDYAHHPEEIIATINVAKDEVKNLGKEGIVIVYQPHQNTRQHEVKAGYKKAFLGVDKVFWLPTYLTREDTRLSVLTPEELISELDNQEIAEPAELNEDLKKKLEKYISDGYIVVLMTAGPADEWLREIFRKA